MKRFGSIGIGILLLCLAPVVPAFAADKTVALASLDQHVLPFAKRQAVRAPIVTETCDCYEIRGASEKDLRDQLQRHGVRIGDGKTYDALTSWDIKWTYDHDKERSSCTADNFMVYVDISIRYPEWSRQDAAEPSLETSWNVYLQNLRSHEQGHRDIAVKKADELSHAVAALPPAATCDDLDRSIAVLGRKLMKELNAEQKAYDTVTGHGATQGASL
ncbi:MAG: DUF922 domain-containing protein [Nitrospiraceae bacterium]|nr:DUF922 domain-containing protein [Nitrospiraceae bacterium]